MVLLRRGSSGELKFTAPRMPGEYEFRLFCCWPKGGYKDIARSNPVKVRLLQVPQLTASPATVAPGEKIVVRFQGAPGNSGDWIAMYPLGAPNENYGEWYYLRGRRDGTLTFTAPKQLGWYEFRMFCCWPEGGYKDIARSNPVRVVESSPSSKNNYPLTIGAKGWLTASTFMVYVRGFDGSVIRCLRSGNFRFRGN